MECVSHKHTPTEPDRDGPGTSSPSLHTHTHSNQSLTVRECLTYIAVNSCNGGADGLLTSSTGLQLEITHTHTHTHTHHTHTAVAHTHLLVCALAIRWGAVGKGSQRVSESDTDSPNRQSTEQQGVCVC